MPFIFLFTGVLLLVAGVRGKSSDLLTLLKGDLTGDNNFTYWILSILVIGALGYVSSLRTLSRSFLFLVILVLILNEGKKTPGGFFQSFQTAFAEITK